MRRFLSFLFFFVAVPAFGQKHIVQSDTVLAGVPLGVDEHEYTAGTVTSHRAIHPVHLGDTMVEIREYARFIEPYAGIRMNMLVLHDNENTAVESGRQFVSEEGGRIVDLQAAGDRRVSFSVGGRTVDFDPNRIFTPIGVRATLGEGASEETEAITQLFGEALIGVYAPRDIVITLHNNTEENYSALNYVEGGIYENDAADVHIEEGSDPDDFFFVTDPDLFSALKSDDFNVVLQDNEGVTDDGSLSIWAAQNDMVYVNVEAQHGHDEEQLRMIKSLAFLLRMLEHRNHTH